MFLKPEPWTPLGYVYYWSFCAACTLLVCLVVAYEVWAPQSFMNQYPEKSVTSWSVVKIPCGGYPMGSLVFYLSPEDPEHEQRSFVCRDWWNARWVFTR